MDYSTIKPELTIFDGSMILFVVYLLISLVALIDLFTVRFKDKNDKIFWLVAVLFLGGFAAVFYFLKRKKLIAPNPSEKSPI